MRIDITDILKSDGASLDIEFTELIQGNGFIYEDIVVDRPVSFIGRMVNAGGVIQFDGQLSVEYMAKCSRCLKDIESMLCIAVKEDFVEESSEKADEHYTYKGKFVELEKVIKDNIILNLPVKLICDDNCKGFCPKCGVDLNNGVCKCVNDDIDPRMKALEDFFKGSK